LIKLVKERLIRSGMRLLYMCDTADELQAQRNRLFLRWFNGYEQQQKYYIQTEYLIDEGIETYVAVIVQRTNPHLEAIISQFNEQIAMFKEQKP